VVLSGVRRCDPCQYLAQFTRADIPRALGQRGGLRAHVVSGGRMRVGDRIVALPSAVDEAPAEPTRSS
jgi:MOSC domain-containing protein YiiM